MKTLLLALISPDRSQGTREGAIRGLVGVGKEAVRKGLVECGGAKAVASEIIDGRNSGTLVDSVLASINFTMILPPDCTYRCVSGCLGCYETVDRHGRELGHVQPRGFRSRQQAPGGIG